MQTKAYDVIVCGGGPAGIAAAVAAARNGAKTLLIEKNAFVGGCAASGLPFLNFFNRNRVQVIRGVGEELVQRDDDKPETVLSRLTVYHDQTAPLSAYYEEKGLLHRIDGGKDRDAIYADILNVLGAKA